MTVDAVGGVWTYALDLALGLAQRGVTVSLAVAGPAPNSAQLADAARVPGLQVIQLGLQLEWMANTAGEVHTAGEALADLAGALSVDVVHLNAPGPAAEAKFPKPVVIMCHSCVATWWHAVRGGPMPEDFRWRAELVSRAYARADLLVAPSAAFAEATQSMYGLPRSPIVISNARRAMPVGQVTASAPFAFTAGRLWDEGKGAATLDEAAAELSFPVVAAGPTRGPNGVHAELRHLRLLGPLTATEVTQHMAAQPIFVSAARYEPFGLSVLEAAQAGCALILADTAGFRELWDGAAEFVPASDAAAFARAIESVAANPARRSALGAAALARSSRYNLDHQADAMLDTYLRLIKGDIGRNAAA